MLIFPSRENLERFLEAAAKSDPEQPGAAFGAEALSLTVHNATQLPATMRREAMQHRWPVTAALALSAFLPKHAAIFKADTFAPVCESYFDDEDRVVRFAVPYEAFGLFDVDESAHQDRNA